MLTERAPADWRALQAEVARILTECGFVADVERRVTTVRGTVVVDVHAEETILGRKYTLLLECKQWKARVPQSVIRDFRTVVADSGANMGYIISQAGFQSGAFSAAELTNVRLLTWEEFQEEFQESWIRKYMLPTVAERCDPLLTFVEPLLPRAFDRLDAKGKERFLELRQKHAPFGWLMMMFTPYLIEVGIRKIGRLPIRAALANPEHNTANIPDTVLDAVGYRDFLDAALAHSDNVTEEFRRIVGDDAP
jgi:restriction system protein